MINREHPKAYLPIVLHQFSHLIKDRCREESTNLSFFSSPVGVNQKESTITEIANSEADEGLKEKESIRSQDSHLGEDEDKNEDEDVLKEVEDKKMTRLVSVIWDDDVSHSEPPSTTPEVCSH